MRVLYLVPPARPAAAPAAHPFIAEEIAAIGRAGVAPFTLTDEPDAHGSIDGVRMVGVEPVRGARSLARSVTFAARHAMTTARSVWGSLHAADALHALRIERAAVDLIRRERIELVHSHFGWPGGLGGQLAARSAGVPLVASVRGMELLTDAAQGHGLRLDPGFDRAIRSLLTTADRIVTATGFMRDRAVALGAPADRVRKIAKGVCTDRFAPASDRRALKRSLGLDGPLVLAAGNLKPLKGFDTLIDAFAGTAAAATLLICGDGPDRAALTAQIENLGRASTIKLLGSVGRDEMPRYFAAADLFVHPSRLEAAGNVILEALSSGCPVICTDCGGPAEFVRQGQTGCVVAVDDVEAMRFWIDTLLADDARRRSMGTAAREYAIAEHAYPRMVGEILDVYAAASAALRPAA
jgi:glycosyltransferase involved in cell wall biosynthesis